MADIYSVRLFDAEAVALGGSATSATIPVTNYKALGNFGTQLLVAGSGSVTVKLYISMNDGESFVEWDYDLWTSKTAGEYATSHGFAVCTHFYVVASSATDASTVTLDMAIQ